MTLPNDPSQAGTAVLYRPQVAAARLSMGTTKLREHINAGTIGHVRIGRLLRVPSTEVDRVISEGLPMLAPRTRMRQAT